MKQLVIAALWTTVIGISGCAQSLPPHEEINQAMKKSFDSTGYNFSSKSRLTELAIPKKQDVPIESADKRDHMKYLESGLDIVQALSINLDGAVDMKTKKTEVLYDLRYEKDNVEVSVKMPLFIDYNTQTIYVGTSLFNTILHIFYPQAPETKGKLIRLNINELLQESAKTTKEPSELVAADRFTAKNIELLSSAINSSILKELARLNDTCFSDQPLTDQDKSAEVARRIQINLGHKDSVAVVINIIDNVSQILFQNGVITKTEYAELLTFTDKQTLESIIDEFSVTMAFDVSVAPSGLVSRVVSQFHFSDKKGDYKIGLENASAFSRYNEPRFSITPETSELVDFKEVLNAIVTSPAKDQTDSEPDPDEPDEE